MLKIFEVVADNSHLVVPQMTITSIKLNQLANRGMIKTNGQKSHLLKPVITGQVALPEKYKSMFPVTKDGKVDTQEMAERAKEAKEEIREKRIAAKELAPKSKTMVKLETAGYTGKDYGTFSTIDDVAPLPTDTIKGTVVLNEFGDERDSTSIVFKGKEYPTALIDSGSNYASGYVELDKNNSIGFHYRYGSKKPYEFYMDLDSSDPKVLKEAERLGLQTKDASEIPNHVMVFSDDFEKMLTLASKRANTVFEGTGRSITTQEHPREAIRREEENKRNAIRAKPVDYNALKTVKVTKGDLNNLDNSPEYRTKGDIYNGITGVGGDAQNGYKLYFPIIGSQIGGMFDTDQLRLIGSEKSLKEMKVPLNDRKKILEQVAQIVAVEFPEIKDMTMTNRINNAPPDLVDRLVGISDQVIKKYLQDSKQKQV